MCRITKKEGKNHKTAGREKNVLELPLKTDFTGKVVVVTGAGGVLCGDMARAFAQAGAIAVLSDINEPAQQAEELVKQGFKAMSIQCDVSDERQVKTMIGKIVVSCGRLDAAYNNAGINSPVAETADTSSEGYDRVMNINLRGI